MAVTEMEDDLIFRRSAAGAPLAIALAAALLVASLALSDPVSSWTAFFLGVGMLAISLARLASRKEFLRLFDDGVEFDTLLYVTRVRWAHVESFSIDRMPQDKIIRVKCTGRFWGRKPFRLSEATWIEGGYFIPNAFEAPLEEILDALTQRLKTYRAARG
jgi:hypothetical protein